MKRFLILAVIVFCGALVVSGSENEEPFQVGEKWVYTSTEQSPGGDLKKNDEDSIYTVLAVIGMGEKKRWIIKSTSGFYDKSPGRWFIDKNRMVHKVDSGAGEKVITNPPVYYDHPFLKVGEEIELQYNFIYKKMCCPSRIVYKRLKNETVIVPAGEYTECHHYVIHHYIYDTLDKPIKGRQANVLNIVEEIFYHPKVNGTVKKIFIKKPTTNTLERTKGFTAIIELKAYTRKQY